MRAEIQGDYSRYPRAIQKPMQCLEGEIIGLREAWEIFHHLFMDEESRTKFLCEHFGGTLGAFQGLLLDDLFLCIARLTDRNSRQQENLSVWALREGIPFARNVPAFGADVSKVLSKIDAAAETIRQHRHKRIAHLDKHVNFGTASLPPVLHGELKAAMEQMEMLLNLFQFEFIGGQSEYKHLDVIDYTSPLEVAAEKAAAYDALERDGKIALNEWVRMTRARRKA
jgi:hypothetical protein